MKRKICLVLAVLMISTAVLSGCSTQPAAVEAAPASPASAESAPAPAGGEEAPATVDAASLKMGWNSYMEGLFITTLTGLMGESVFKAMGINDIISVNDEASAEKSVENASALIASGVNGIMLFSLWDNVLLEYNSQCAENNVALSLVDAYPNDQTAVEALLQNPNFAGILASDHVACGIDMAQYSYDNGCRSAILVGVPQGSVTNDQKMDGFTEKFTELGGKVAQEVRTDPSETDLALSMMDDAIIANTDADVIILCAGMFAEAGMSVVDKHPDREIKIICTDLEDNVLEAVKTGRMLAGSGGNNVAGIFSAVALYKKMMGDPFVDENGNPPVVRAVKFDLIKPETVDLFVKLWNEMNAPYTQEEIIAMTQMDWATFKAEVLDKYCFEDRFVSMYEAGVLTAEELDAAGIAHE